MTLKFEPLNHYVATRNHGTYFVSRLYYGSSEWSASRVHGDPIDVERLGEGLSLETAIAVCNARDEQLTSAERAIVDATLEGQAHAAE